MDTKKIGLFAVVLGIGLMSFWLPTSKVDQKLRIAEAEKHKGVCWAAGRREVTKEQVDELASRHVEWISQTPFGWQNEHDSPEIRITRQSDRFQPMWGEREQGLITTTRLAKEQGIKTILKPHIWLRSSTGKWRGEIAMKSEADWQKWFEIYGAFILRYAKLAEQEKIEILCIGTELHQTCKERNADWRKLITNIRKIYSGKLTYAANFNQEYKDVGFWDMLDYIGVQAYFPLSERENPSLEQLKKGWKKPIAELKAFSKKHKKPILFTEVGYKSTKDAAIEPWTWPQHISREERENHYSEETQAACYEALFQTVWKEPWLAGIYLWKWYPNYQHRVNEGNRNNRDRRNYFNIDFTPQNKQAEGVMKRWFGKK